MIEIRPLSYQCLPILLVVASMCSCKRRVMSQRCCARLRHASQQQLTMQQQRRRTCWLSEASCWPSCAAWQCCWQLTLQAGDRRLLVAGPALAEVRKAAVAVRCVRLASWDCAQVGRMAICRLVWVPIGVCIGAWQSFVSCICAFASGCGPQLRKLHILLLSIISCVLETARVDVVASSWGAPGLACNPL
jgi:hypothetical protein